jgi:hypothetical protein
MAKTKHHIAGAIASRLAHALLITCPRHMQHLRSSRKIIKRLGDEGIQPSGPLAAAHDNNRGPRGIESKLTRRHHTIRKGPHLFPHGRTCDHHRAARKIGNRFFEPDKYLITPASCKPIRLAGQRIGIVHEGFEPELVTRIHWCQRSESTHADYGIRLACSQDCLALANGAPEFPQKGQHFRRSRGRLSNGRNGNEFEVAILARGLAIHRLLRNEKHRLVSACPQFLCHGDAGKQMPTCAAAGDHDFHRMTHGCLLFCVCHQLGEKDPLFIGSC